MKATLSLLLFIAAFFVPNSVLAAGEPLRVFIRGGAKTHGPGQHDHPRFLKDWKELLTQRGIKADGSLQFPTAAQLNDTDVVVIYAADGMKIVGEERTRFEGFLRKGGGVVVIHDGVVSGDEHEWAKKIQGGAWVWTNRQTKWQEGEVGIYFVDTEHPITRGISNFDWQDEIYYELDMAPDAKVLATSFHSVFVIAPQLWTYEKTLEGGTAPYRAFVSLPGHEYASFETPHYRAILMRGIAWAGKRAQADEFCSKEELASLTYPAGGPTAPAKAVEKLQAHPEFAVSLVAAEPLIEKPISIDWDVQGRLWIAETPEYPGGRTINKNDKMVALWNEQDPTSFKNNKETRPARDRISWVEDTNGDGVMDRKQVFYEGLELVTSLVFYKDGVIVAQAPDILWVRDTDGDGKGDKVQKVLTGFGTMDTHAVLNNFRWGMDGWVYGAVGYSGGDPKSGDGEISHGKHNSAIFRFTPDGKAFEVLASTACNTWGFDFGWDGEMYYSTPTCGDHALHVVMPERILARGQVGGVRAQSPMQDHNRVKPLVHHTRPAYVQIDVVGGFTAAAGACLYTGGAWPERFNNTFFVSEPTVSLVHQDFLTPKSTTFNASREAGREDSEFLATTDLWFRPIHQRIGPDGALYVVDFYNQAAIHNDTRGPKHGANNAATRPDRDHHFGRIWRVQHKQATALPPAFAVPDANGLVQALEHPNGWVRMTAHRLLTEAANPGVAPAVAKLFQNSPSPAGRLHAMWLLNNLQRLDEPLLLAALNDAHPAVRKNALRLVAESDRQPGAKERSAVTARLNDPDARAKLQAVIALGTLPVDAELARTVVNLWPGLQDRYLESAALGVAAKKPLLFLEAALNSGSGAAEEKFVRLVTGSFAAQAKDSSIGQLVSVVAGAPGGADALKQVALEALAAQLKPQVTPAWTAELQSALKSLVQAPQPALAAAALPLIARWDKDGSMKAEVQPLLFQLKNKLNDSSMDDDARGRVAINLLGVRQYDPGVFAIVAQLLAPSGSEKLQKQVLQALGTTDDPAAGQVLIKEFPKLSPPLADVAFAQIIKRADWSTALLQAVANKSIELATLGPSSVHRLRTHSDAKVAARANDVIAQLRGPEQKEKEKLVNEFLAVAEKQGDIGNGKKLYDQNCAVCHTFKGTGRNVAPDLTGMGVHGSHELLTHILDPNRLVEPNYVATSIETKDDNSYDGIIAGENRSSVTLRNASGDVDIRTADIKSRRTTGRSLMPEGFEALTAEGLRDIISYVSADDRRYRVIDLRAAFTADSTRGIYGSRESTNESLFFKKFGLVKAGDIPFEIVSPARSSSGYNVVVLKGGDGFARTLRQRVEIDKLSVAASKLHFLGGVGGWAWPFGGDRHEGLKVAKVTVHFHDGQSEEIVLTNGVEIADYNGRVDVPGSKALPDVVSRGQVRWFTKPLKHRGVIEKIVLESFANDVAPTFVSITAELADAQTAQQTEPPK